MAKERSQEFINMARRVFPVNAFSILVLVLLGDIGALVVHGMSRISSVLAFDVGMDILGIVVCLILIYSCIMEQEYDSARTAFIRLVFLIGLNLNWDVLAWTFNGMAEMSVLVKLFNSLYFMMGYFMSLHFWEYMETQLKLKGFRGLRLTNVISCWAGVLIMVFNWPFHYLFDILEDGSYRRGSFYWLCLVPVILTFVTVAFVVLKQRISFRERAVFLSYEAFPLAALLCQIFNYELSILYPGCLLGTLVVYANIYTQRRKMIAEQQAKLSEQNIAIMVSQIQPHFLYNTLTTISNLCRTDPEAAEEATVLFSQYLRGNLDALRRSEPVPFATELNHVRNYLVLEQKRFGDKLSVKYDIQEQHFRVPALSLQPIVENSVKHGICEKDGGGTVTISSCAVEGGYLVVVEDDGVGFDPAKPREDDGRSHVGMDNVTERLKKMCGAELKVISSPGKGCRTEIRVPAISQERRGK